MADIPAWLNYHHLLYFAAVVEEQGLVPAAQRLGVSHPTVSEQLKKLERALGLPLFQRRGRRLELTEQGALVYGYAREIFGLGAALVDAVEARRSGRHVIARIGIDSVLPKLLVRRLLTPALDELGEALRLRCVEDERERLLTDLASRRLDLVLSDTPALAAAQELRSHPLAASPIALFAARRVADELQGDFPACLDGAPFLLPMPATRLRRELERWLGEHRIRPRIVAEVEDSGLLKAFGQNGRGVFAMPSVVAEEIERQYQVRRIGVIEELESRVFALTGSSGSANAAVRVLLSQERIAPA